MDKILSYALKKKKGYDLFEVGTGTNVSIKNIVKLIKKVCKNKTSKLNFGKIPMRKNELFKVNLNLKKLTSLKWKPKYNLENSLKKTVNYYKN
jgi:nucleoside-diphosphate-sugar epimerase